MRPRDLTRFGATTYDLLVIGGGIHGLSIAYEAASRGLRTALVEAGDLGSGASFNHQKTVHGGLRSLQSLSLRRARESILERRALARIAPWFLRPLPFIVGTHRSIVRGRLAFRAAFRLDRWLGRDRNADVEPELHLPAARLVSKAATLRLFPGVRQERLTGAAQWYDYQMVEADRLTFAFAAAADRAGADIANYVEALTPLRSAGRISGMTVRDVFSGDTLSINALVTVNAAGGRARTIMQAFGVSRSLPLLHAMNLVTSRPASDIALAAPSPTGQMLTLVPWRGRAIVGTGQSKTLVQPDAAGVTASEVDAFIAEANETFPALRLTRDDVTLVHRGIVPAAQDGRVPPALLSTPGVYDHAADGAAGAVTVIGVKYTTARRVAQTTIERIAKRLGKRLKPSRTATTVLPGAGIADHEALAIETARACGLELRVATIRHLIGLYAERTADIVRLMHERPDLQAPLSPAVATLGAEVVHVIRHEMAVRLSDVAIRRTGLGAAGPPEDAALRRCAEIAARELGWEADRTEAELAAVRQFYVIPEA
jgi:glycerol-3-phosphate dehydrogenase